MGTEADRTSGRVPGPSVVPGGAVWSAVVSDPNTGVSVLSMVGTILWANDQAARIFFGPDSVGTTYAGKNLFDVFPKEWAEERRVLLHRMLETRRPLMIRTIWRGFQHMTWVHHIASDEADPQSSHRAEVAERGSYLCITRRIPSDEGAEELASQKYDVVDSRFVDLGPLEVLTARELEVLALIGQGLRAEEIARILSLSVKTVGNHRDNIARKLDTRDRVHLAEIARRAGLTLGDAERKRV